MILVISDSLIERSFLQIYFESTFNLSPTFSQAKNFKKHEFASYKMVIFGNFLSLNNAGINYKDVLQLENKNIIILYHEKFKETVLYKYLKNKIRHYDFNYKNIDMCEEYLPKYTNRQDYHRIENFVFDYIDYLPCNIYEKTNNKFHLYLETNSTSSTFNESGDYFVQDRDYKTLYEQLKFLLLKNNFKKFKKQSGIENEKGLYQKAQKLAFEMGVSNNTIAIVNELINEIFSKDNNEDIFKIINKIYEQRFFITEHSLALAYLTIELLNNLRITDPLKKRKLITAAIIHDLSINPEIKHMEEDNEYKPDDFFIHSSKIKSFVEKLPIGDEELKRICEYHHELPDGSGFFKTKANNLSYMEFLFNMAHFFIVEYLNNKDKRKSLKTMLNKGYHDNNHHKIFRSLCEVSNLPFLI